ncbi:S1 family peptidase [Microbispora sp. NPDC049125]|uniref:S1 family peptidase n=1 Tax=Microbispora sp. NPDC049125 TaxID=3154929 RepID=UPI003465A588
MQNNVRLRLMVLSAACVLMPFLGAGAAGAQAADDPDLTRPAAAVPDGKTPAADDTGPRGPVPGGFAGWNALFTEQTRLNGVADRILAAAENTDGYGGLVADPENHEVRLYWRGTVPRAVQDVVEQGRQTAPVSVLPAAYTRAQLLQETDRWTESGQVTGAAPAADGSGVRLSVAGEDTGPDQLQRPAGATAPITLERGERFDPAYSRQDDVPSYYAGGRTWNQQSGAGCTSGFAVWDKYGNRGFLTAAHCGALWENFYDGGGTWSAANYMGPVTWRVTKRDAAIVQADATADMFDGNSSASTSNRVVALWKAHVGNFVCNSGASLGENCLIKVTETGWSGTYSNGQYVKHMVRAKSVDGGCAVAHGDSGGPVFSYTNWFDEIAAQGITSAVSKPVYCGGLDGGRVIVFSRAWDVVLEFGAYVMVH